MHDLLLAKDILTETLKQAQKLKLKKISKITVSLGQIDESYTDHDHHSSHEITPVNLKFNFNLIKTGTIATQAILTVEPMAKLGWRLKNIYGTKSRSTKT